jgi:hypothetical protein
MLKKSIDAYRCVVVFGDLEECCMRIETHSSISLKMVYLGLGRLHVKQPIAASKKDSYKPRPSGCRS